MDRSKLPIGIQTFRKFREEGYYYVDKTAWIRRLLNEGKHYFLSRPRRFGKSLFLDTLKELFEGNEALFEGLHIHHRWDWSVRHPVVRLSFGSGSFKEPGYVHKDAMAQLDAIEEEASVAGRYDTAPARLRHLIQALHRRTDQRAVILVDEYDKPILDALEAPETARANRDFLRGLYAVIKDCDANVRFTFLTGVSKFSKVSLFSGLNNLTDITLEPEYSAVCGYTEADLDTVFAPELAGLDREAVRDWYNGYGWLGEEKVYNPFDILLLFRRRKFGAYWFETGTPSFLIDVLSARGVASPALDGMIGTDALLSAFDVDEIGTEALLFQTGYLTIREEEASGGEPFYRLGYPNREVRQSLNRSLLRAMAPDPSRQLTQGVRLRELLAANDFDGLEELFRAFFSAIPHDWHRRNEIARYEGYLRERVLLPLRRGGAGRGGGGREPPRAGRHGGALQRPRLPSGVQGGRVGAGGGGDGAAQGPPLRGQVPRSRRADPPHRGGVQPQGPQPRRIRGRARLTGKRARQGQPGRNLADR